MSISASCIRRPIATSLLTAGLLLLGLLGYRALSVSALPTVDFPTIEVSTSIPGASPDVMVSSVTTPLESQLGQIPGLIAMSSVSSFSRSAITLRFALDRNIDSAAQDVQAAISASSGLLPNDLPSPPTFSKANPTDAPILVMALTSDVAPLSRVNDYAETILAQKLAQLDGVGRVSIQGGQKRAVRLQIAPQALAGLQIGLEDVRAAIARVNVNAPKGSLDGNQQSYTIAANDQLFAAETYREVVIAWRNGAPVRLKDVGDAIDSVENIRVGGWSNGKPAILIDIKRQPGANIISTVDRIKTMLPQLRAALPSNVSLTILSDRTDTIRSSIEEVEFSLILSIGLVVMVIFLYLRTAWATLIPSIVLPLSLVGTFGGMYIAGFSLNNLSLMALTIAVGFVVDDAIVMIENIVRHIEEGMKPFDAALKGAREISFTIISLTVSLIAVFIPLLLMGGVVGRLFREFAITLSLAVVVSAIVSLTLTPMMCAYLLKPRTETRARAPGLFERALNAQLRLYARSLDVVLRFRKLTLAVTVAALGATFYVYTIIPKGFLPQQDTGLIIGITDVAPDVSYLSLISRQREVAELVQQDPDVENVVSFAGTGSVNATPNSGQLYITLKPRRARSADIGQIVDRLRARISSLPGIDLFMQATQDIQLDNRISRTQYQYTLQDTDTKQLAVWAPQLVAALQKRSELVDVATDQQLGGLSTIITIRRDDAAKLGVPIQSIDDTLYDAFGQRKISTIYTQLTQYHVILELAPRFQQDPSVLDLLYVNSTSGAPVRLSALADFSTGVLPLTINHLGRFPVVTLSFNLAPGASLGQAVAAIEQTQREIALPSSVLTQFSGSAAEFGESLRSQPFLILAAIVVVYIVLGVLYESLIHPITILSTLPSAGLGALLALHVSGFQLDLISLIGIILLIGLVKKNAIMMIDFALEAERSDSRITPFQAIREACLLRFRPIMMTTMAALLGALPLALSGGTGSELRQPLGVAILGGLIVSQFLTLYTTPVVYLLFAKMGGARRHGRKPAPHAVADVSEKAPAVSR